MIDLILQIVGVVVILILIYYIVTLRKIVPPNAADVVVNVKGGRIYSGDQTVTASQKPEPVYYQWPAWLPFLGVTVRRMPLNIIEIPIKNFETFAKGNPRFTVDVSVYCKITDVNEAARRFPEIPGSPITESFRKGIQEIVIGAVRTATANYNIEDIIAKREELASVVKSELETDFKKWGCEITNVAFVSIRDPDDDSSTVVFDISNKKEAEINATSRMEVANRKRQAEIAEAEAREAAERRKIEADEQIAMRGQEMKMRVAEQQQLATVKEMEVYQTQEIRKAEIDGDAAIKVAERQKQATVELANATKQKLQLEGEGQAKNKELVGTAEAVVVQKKLEADAAGQLAIAKAQEYQQNNAIEVLRLEVNQAVAKAYATALQNAKVEYIGSGHPRDFLDLFTPEGGMSVGGALKTLQRTAPEANIVTLFADAIKTSLGTNTPPELTTEKLGGPSWDADALIKMYESMTPEQKTQIVQNLIRRGNFHVDQV